MGRGKRPQTSTFAPLFEELPKGLPAELENDTIVEVPGDDRTFIVRVIQTGELYGRNRVLRNEGQPLVCFFDSKNRFPAGDVDEQHYGQATGGQYHLETLLAHAPDAGLDLHGGVDVWKVPAESVPPLLTFLRRQRAKPIRDRLSPLAEHIS